MFYTLTHQWRKKTLNIEEKRVVVSSSNSEGKSCCDFSTSSQEKNMHCVQQTVWRKMLTVMALRVSYCEGKAVHIKSSFCTILFVVWKWFFELLPREIKKTERKKAEVAHQALQLQLLCNNKWLTQCDYASKNHWSIHIFISNIYGHHNHEKWTEYFREEKRERNTFDARSRWK